MFFVACSGDKEQHYILIAHAGGAIDGHTYTNSLEAAQQSIANGYKYLEFDLQFTSDSVLVAAHTWKEFNEMTGFPQKLDSVPTYDEYCSRLIYGKYTPLTAFDIHTLFMDNPALFFVTDKISSVPILLHYFSDLKKRMIVEAFSYEDYVELQDSGFFRPLYSCMSEDVYSSLTKHLMFYYMYDGPQITWLSIHTSVFSNAFYKFLYRFYDFETALFTVNDVNEIPTGYRDNIRYIYTDSIMP